MIKIHKSMCRLLLLVLVLVFFTPLTGYAEEGYRLIIDDKAQLLTQQEEYALAEDMRGITEYGHVAFLTVDDNLNTAEVYARRFYRDNFSEESGTVFLIDMSNRKIWIVCNGAISRTIDNDYTEVITDNIYTYATKGEYYTCAKKAYEQIYTLLVGGRIAQPMKFICNAFLALGIALIVNFLILHSTMGKLTLSKKELLKNVAHKYVLKDKELRVMYTTREYSPQNSDSGGSSGSSGGGSRSSGGGGGGGSSGGHSF